MYDKKTWAANEVITAKKLNDMEKGIDVAYPLNLVFSGSGDTATCNATWDDILVAYNQVRSLTAVYRNSIVVDANTRRLIETDLPLRITTVVRTGIPGLPGLASVEAIMPVYDGAEISSVMYISMSADGLTITESDR